MGRHSACMDLCLVPHTIPLPLVWVTLTMNAVWPVSLRFSVCDCCCLRPCPCTALTGLLLAETTLWRVFLLRQSPSQATQLFPWHSCFVNWLLTTVSLLPSRIAGFLSGNGMGVPKSVVQKVAVFVHPAYLLSTYCVPGDVPVLGIDQ